MWPSYNENQILKISPFPCTDVDRSDQEFIIIAMPEPGHCHPHAIHLSILTHPLKSYDPVWSLESSKVLNENNRSDFYLHGHVMPGHVLL